MESLGDKFVIFDKNHKHGVFDQPLFEISINLNLFSQVVVAGETICFVHGWKTRDQLGWKTQWKGVCGAD